MQRDAYHDYIPYEELFDHPKGRLALMRDRLSALMKSSGADQVKSAHGIAYDHPDPAMMIVVLEVSFRSWCWTGMA